VARLSLRLPQNADGDLYVDSTCIDCDTCRQLLPGVYGRSDAAGKSYVRRQPADDAERERSLMALVACPTASIGTEKPADTARAASRFPLDFGDGVAFCGFTSEDSFGAWSWFVPRPDGNVLVDSPRAASRLLDALASRGGVARMFLTHRDDVADHDVFARRFGCERTIHKADATGSLAKVERLLAGGEPVEWAKGCVAIPTPGHTAGSACLLVDERDLFTGDHLWGTEDGTGLEASRSVCWHSWDAQVRSVERLLRHPFRRVLPGHGPVFVAPTPAAAHDALRRCLDAMRASQAPGR
jgi:glyoxylase-like metal-dependent hydrolase (beta-lactamase superfamily II)/ferredoxin